MKKLFILIGCLIVTGCFNYRELDELAIMSAVGLDIKDENYIITSQIVNITKKNSDIESGYSKPEFNIYEIESKTIQEGLRKVVDVSPKRLYAEHLQLYIIGEELAYQGIDKIMDIVFRDTESRKQFLVIIAKNGQAKDILKTITPLEGINANSIVSMIKTNEKYLGATTVLTMEEFLNDYLNKKREIFIPTITLKSDYDYDNIDSLKKAKVDDILEIGSTGLFKDSKLALYLDNKESIYFSFLKNNINESVLTLKCDENNYTTLEITSNKTKFNYNKTFYIDIRVKANINEITCNINLEDEKEIKKLEKLLANNIKSESEKLINKLYKENKIDSLNINDYLYKNNNKFYKTINFDEFINNLNFEIKVKASIAEKGNTLRVINNENK